MEVLKNNDNDNCLKKITDLKLALKDKNRVNVFVDHKFAFSLTVKQISELKIKIGNSYNEEEIRKIQASSDFGKLFQRSLEYALTRPHSEKELRDYLKRKKIKREVEQKRYDEFILKLKNDEGYREKIKELRQKVREKNQQLSHKDFTEDNRFEYSGCAKTNLPTKPAAPISENDIEKVIQKLITLNIIDDKNFAKFYIENRNRVKGISEKKLRLELKNKGITDSIITEILSENEFGERIRDDKIEIQKMIEKKLRRGYTDEKLKQYLMRQGFSYDLIKEALVGISENIDDII